MKRKLHVLFLPSWYPSPRDPVNGIFHRQQALALHEAGVQVGVVYPELSYWRRLSLSAVWEGMHRTGLRNEDGIMTYRLHRWYMVWFQRWLGTRAFITGVRRYLRQVSRPDLIHVHSADFAGLAAKRILETEGLPYIITEHSSAYYEHLYNPRLLAVLRTAFDHSLHVIAVSQAAAGVLVDVGMCPEEKISVIPNIVDTRFFFPPQQGAMHTRPFRFLTVSLFYSIKRVDWILRAFARAFPADKDVLLEIGGDGVLRGQLEQLAQELDLTHRVKFLGLLDRAGVRDAMQRANCFVLASLFETFGVVLIEALACGIPVISTACGGPEDIVVPEVGLLVSNDEPHELAAAMQRVRDDWSSYLPSTIRGYAEQRFSKNAVTAQIIEQYQIELSTDGRSEVN